MPRLLIYNLARDEIVSTLDASGDDPELCVELDSDNDPAFANDIWLKFPGERPKPLAGGDVKVRDVERFLKLFVDHHAALGIGGTPAEEAAIDALAVAVRWLSERERSERTADKSCG